MKDTFYPWTLPSKVNKGRLNQSLLKNTFVLLSAPEYVLFFLFNLDSVYFMEKAVSEEHGPLSQLHLLPPKNSSLYLSCATFLESLLTRIQFSGSVPDLWPLSFSRRKPKSPASGKQPRSTHAVKTMLSFCLRLDCLLHAGTVPGVGVPTSVGTLHVASAPSITGG